ncbi:hypothetical protein Aperf_G00000103077 [Anoplocephala perfoliata]
MENSSQPCRKNGLKGSNATLPMSILSEFRETGGADVPLSSYVATCTSASAHPRLDDMVKSRHVICRHSDVSGRQNSFKSPTRNPLKLSFDASSDNFCFYNNFYDSIKGEFMVGLAATVNNSVVIFLEGAWTWAQETLKKHSHDVRQSSYNEETMESACTGDELWNAAQRQLLRDGKIHGFMRMYWAKKILEWHAGGPEKALQLGFRLNDKYSLDGADPNGYIGQSALVFRILVLVTYLVYYEKS